ncbi:MAG: Sec-independent protein translocase protein TatB [Sphingomonadaceae bacterium]|nr:Sec-independent protein translocase protein TatB [Sphingomonadaceae bacterium]
MFDIDMSELGVVGIVALLVVGPKDLPKLMRTVGQWVGRARGMTRHLRAGFDEMVRQAEIEELNKRWNEQNREIMERTRVDTWMDPEPSVMPAAHEPAPVMTPLPAPPLPEPGQAAKPPPSQLA